VPEWLQSRRGRSSFERPDVPSKEHASGAEHAGSGNHHGNVAECIIVAAEPHRAHDCVAAPLSKGFNLKLTALLAAIKAAVVGVTLDLASFFL